jgi:tetratricopeptide (TPR) repeat protein
LQDLDELLKLRPDIAENWAYRGNILEDLGYQKDAFADYSQAISLGMEQIKSRNFDNEFIGLISDVCFAYAFLAKNFKMYSSAKEALATTIEMYKLRADLGDNMARSRLPSLESELRLWTSEINQIYARQQQQRIQQEQQQRARQEQQQMEAARLAMQNRSAGSSSFSGSSSGQSRQRAIYASGPSAPPQALQSYQLNEVRRNREHHVSTHHYVAERIESARSSVGSAVRTPMRVRHMPHRPAPMMLRH